MFQPFESIGHFLLRHSKLENRVNFTLLLTFLSLYAFATVMKFLPVLCLKVLTFLHPWQFFFFCFALPDITQNHSDVEL